LARGWSSSQDRISGVSLRRVGRRSAARCRHRAATVPFAAIAAHWPIIVNLLVGSLVGAWFGAGWATRLASQTLYRVIAVLLLGIAVVLVLGHDTGPAQALCSRARRR
jgi:uncharacterized protein